MKVKKMDMFSKGLFNQEQVLWLVLFLYFFFCVYKIHRKTYKGGS